MRDESQQKEKPEEVKIRCHRHILIAQSDYFKGLMEFNEAQQSGLSDVTLNVHEYTPEVFTAMLKFIYLGEAQVNSNDLVDLLNLCQEYLLPAMKQAIEHVFAEQLNVELFVDIYMVAKAFDCRFLKERVIAFGIANKAALRQKQMLEQLDKAD